MSLSVAISSQVGPGVGKKTKGEIPMYMMFQAPGFKHQVDQISWDAPGRGHGGVHANETVLAGGGRGCSVTQRGCGQSSWTVGGAERSSASRVAALRHLSPYAAHVAFAQGRRVLDSLRIGCVPARP